jgi:hypothetical protein
MARSIVEAKQAKRGRGDSPKWWMS